MADAHTAKAVGRNLPISTKQCIEIGNFIRGKSVTRAKVLLEGVIAKKVAVPMKRFNMDTGHKRGPIAAGRYPINASKEILELVQSAEMNALNKGLNVDILFIKTYMANKGSSSWRFGRQRRRQAKRTNVEIVLEEIEAKKPAKKPSVPEKKEAPKEEKKPVKETTKEKPVKEEQPKEAPKEKKVKTK